MPGEQHGAPVTVRYWAGARAAAGVDQDQVSAEVTAGAGLTVAGVLESVTARRPALGAIVGVSTLLLDGRAVRADAPITGGALLEVLPPFAGG